MVARSGREFAVAHGAQLPAERLLGDCNAEFLEDPLRQIDQPPAHHAMDRRDRATLDHAGDGLTLEVIELGRFTRRLAVQESVRPASVEAQHPVPDDLKPDAADLGRLGTRRTVIDCRKRQKPPGLRTVFGSPGQNCGAAMHQNPSVRVSEPTWRTSLVRHLESDSPPPGNRPRVTISGTRY